VEKIIAFIGIADVDQGCTFTKPPLFYLSNFSHWKKLVHVFIKDYDYDLSKIILKGEFITTVKKNDNNYSSRN